MNTFLRFGLLLALAMLVGCEGFDGKNNDFARGYINEDTNVFCKIK